MNKNLSRQGLLLAIKRNELDLFLSGTGMYRLGYNPYSPVNSMLNLAPAMAEIYSYCVEEPQKRIDLTLQNTLMEWLTWKSGTGVFAVFLVLSYQLKMEQLNKSPFKLDRDKIINELKNVVSTYEDKLKKIKEYEGESLKEGLWEALQIENNMNIKNYGIKIL